MTILQGSPEWHAKRCGKATASEFSCVLAKGEGKTRASYMRRIVAERLTGEATMDGYRNGDMDRGKEQEPLARMAYELRSGHLVEEIDFVEHATLMAGCSPDGLIDRDGGCEIKCVLPHVHVETMLRGGCPPEHRSQIQGSLWVTGRQWWDFVSYSPKMPEHLKLYRFRVARDEAYIETLEAEVRKFLIEVDRTVELLMGAQAKKVA